MLYQLCVARKLEFSIKRCCYTTTQLKFSRNCSDACFGFSCVPFFLLATLKL